MVFEKTKFKSLKLEDIDMGVVYAITLNPSDRRMENTLKDMVNDIQVQKTIQNNMLEEIKCFKRYIKHAKLELYPELSRNGRLHFHGYIIIYNPVLFVFRDMKYIEKNIANYEIDTIDPKTADTYNIYVKKQLKLMTEVVNDEFNLPFMINTDKPIVMASEGETQ